MCMFGRFGVGKNKSEKSERIIANGYGIQVYHCILSCHPMNIMDATVAVGTNYASHPI